MTGLAASPVHDDADLVRRCIAGDQGAWADMVDRYSRYVHAICVSAYRLSPADAEDVFQEVFARLYEHLGRLRDTSAVKAWIGQVTRRLCIDSIRGGGREVPLDESEPPPGVDDEIARVNEALAVHQALATLPEHCREVLDRFFCRDQSYHAISEELAIAPGTIASRISRCLGRLRQAYGAR